MCLNPARLATAVALVLAAGLAASPASAGLFGGSKPAAAAPAKPAATSAPAAADPNATKPRKATPEERAAAQRLEPLARAAFWSRELQVDPSDADAGVKLSQALRALGQNDQAMQTADNVLVGAPKNLEALLEDARAKIAANKAFYAIEVLQRAKAVAPKDWRPVSLMGVALEQSERPEEARQAFEQALALSPENTAVLSNLGLFYAMRGAPDQAEQLMRRAVARPDAGPKERQNLALVLGLQGKLPEAEKLLRQDLPPDQVDADLAYLRQVNAPAEARATTTANVQAATTPRNWSTLEGAQLRK